MPAILRNHYVLAVPDLRVAAAFYIDILGFDLASEHPGWVFVAKDDCMVMLGECPDDLDPGTLGSHRYFAYLVIDDATAYRAQIEAKRPGCAGPMHDRPWGMREFGVTTDSGHTLMVGQQVG